MPRAQRDPNVVRAGLDLALRPGPTFELVVAELRTALARAGIRLEAPSASTARRSWKRWADERASRT